MGWAGPGLVCPWFGLTMVWNAPSLGWLLAGLATCWPDHGLVGNGLGWIWPVLALFLSGHGLAWPWNGLAMC